MKSYSYKIQWLFSVTDNFVTPKTTLRRELYSVIKILGARSLDRIIFRDSDLKIVHYYNSMQQYSSGEADKQTIQYIRKYLKANPEIKTVELLRK
jgi:hypothetical protein